MSTTRVADSTGFIVNKFNTFEHVQGTLYKVGGGRALYRHPVAPSGQTQLKT